MNSNSLLYNLKIIMSLKIIIVIEFLVFEFLDLGEVENQVEVGSMQLALPLLLRDKLQWVNDIVVYDPVLTPLEQKVILSLNCTCPSFGKEKGRKVERPTLFFIPHCSPIVTENILKANWSRSELKNIVTIANELKMYDDEFLSSFHYITALYLSDPHALLEIPLPKTYIREHRVN